MTNQQREFWSTVARDYDRVVDRQIGGTTRFMVRERVAQEGGLGTVVELGCGTGFYTDVLAGKAERVVATDLSPGMLALAKERIRAPNVTFQLDDCQRTSLPGAAFDTAFISLVLHFTEPQATIAEMHRLLKPGGLLIVANLDPRALGGLDRLRSVVRILYHGVVGYRLKPPKGFGNAVMTERELRELLGRSGFAVLDAETVRDASRVSNIPVEYVRARRMDWTAKVPVR